MKIRESSARRPSQESQADMEQLATFDDDPMQQAAKMRAVRVLAAVTPRATAETTRLTPSQTAYVQAWMRENGRRR
jgi:hypothetical protein